MTAMAVRWQPPQGSWASSEAIRRTMLACRSRDTRPELVIRSLAHRAGLRFRVAARPIRGVRRTADMIFRSRRIAVFIDGCFWHGCPEHYVPPGTNRDYWRQKVAGNRERDADTDALLAARGWSVLRIWEHEDPAAAAATLVAAVRPELARRD